MRAAVAVSIRWVTGERYLRAAGLAHRRRAKVMPGWVGALLPVVTLLAIVGSNAGTTVLIGVFLVVVCGRIAAAASVTSGGSVRRSLGQVEG